MSDENSSAEPAEAKRAPLSATANKAIVVASGVTKSATEATATLASEAASAMAGTAIAVRKSATAVGHKATRLASGAATGIGDLNGDGVVDARDLQIARAYATGALSAAADGLSVAGSVVGQEAANLAKSVARAPLTKDVATYAAVGAAIALPLPIVGPAIGAAVGAGLGLWRNATRHETLVPEPRVDVVAELERLHGLKEKGILTEEEFAAQKRKILR